MITYITSQYLADSSVDGIYLSSTEGHSFAKKEINNDFVTYHIRIDNKDKSPLKLDNYFLKTVDLNRYSVYKRVSAATFDQYVKYLKTEREVFHAETRRMFENGSI